MTNNRGSVRISRKEAQGMEELIRLYIQSEKIGAGLNRRRIFEAWNEVTGAGAYTLRYFVSDGILTCTLSSSMVRDHLLMQKDIIVEKINEVLKEDPFFNPDDKLCSWVKSLVLR